MDTLVIDIEDDFLTDDKESHTHSSDENDDGVEAEVFPLSKDGYSPTDDATDGGANRDWFGDVSEDDEDDNITINIGAQAYVDQTENHRLNKILDYNYYSQPRNYTNGKWNTAAVYHLRTDDIELNNEIDRLVAASVNLRTTKVITVFVRNTLILVPTDMPISSRLADCIWPTERRMHTSYRFNNINLFNNMLPKTNRLETLAFFAARYKNVQVTLNQGYRPPLQSGRLLTPPTVHNAATGQYLYDDFALVIVNGGKVVDAAIHGVQSNINELVSKYKPRRIYCNMLQGDALDVFLNYPYQPFYQSFHSVLAVPMYVDTAKVPMNTIPFCSRHDPFCAFCKALLSVRAFFQNTLRTPRFVQRITPSSSDITNRRRITKRNLRRYGRVCAAITTAKRLFSAPVMVNIHRRSRPKRRPTYDPTASQEYVRKLASTVSPRYNNGEQRRRVIVLNRYR